MATKQEKKLAKKLAREQLLIQIRKDTLRREESLDEATLKKIKNRWFESIIDTKIPQMQDNLRHILHYMEKLLEAESYRKSLFEDERRELEEKTTLMAQSHFSALETLFDIYEKRIQDLHHTYNEAVADKKTKAEEEFNKMEEREKITEENMQAMLFKMNQNRDEKEEIMNFEMFLKLDDERSKNTEKKENLRTKLEKNMEKRWGEIAATLTKYEITTKNRRKEFLLLKSKDDADCKIILQQTKKTQKLFEQLDELKKCIDECYAPKETIALIRDAREERAKFFETFNKLKMIVDDELKSDEMNLKILTVATNALLHDLRKICVKGEHILTLYRICLHLETEHEKVVPPGYLLRSYADETKNMEGSENIPKTDSILHLGGQHNWTKDTEVLSKFWKKVGSVRLSEWALRKCIKDMQKENKLLKQILSSYMRDVSKKTEKFQFEFR